MARKEFDDSNRGALFKNDQEGNDKRPNLVGPLDIDGKKFRLAGWTREIERGERAGEKFISLQVEPADDKENKSSAKADDDDDIPF